MSVSGLVLTIGLVLPTSETLAAALDVVDPPPALRASFTATLRSDLASRTFRYDPFADQGKTFQVVRARGHDVELDAIVEGWRAEGQADGRLFADDLRLSLGAARVRNREEQSIVEFRHRISPNDGPVDVVVSSRMIGELALDQETGHLSEVTYRIVRPVKLDDGTTLKQYEQTYSFGYSPRWDVSYVRRYQMQARGGRWGFSDTRHFRVDVRDVRFRMAGDAEQELVSRPAEAFEHEDKAPPLFSQR